MLPVHFMTDQETFDRVVDHLFEQRRAAILPRGGAGYRSPAGGCPSAAISGPPTACCQWKARRCASCRALGQAGRRRIWTPAFPLSARRCCEGR
jgi:hypothetical protein